ncbi:MAG: DUF6049 family protein [Bowdeniella nasicola]|nr:DUF6049 family protein [Bowdeniella nasicola]
MNAPRRWAMLLALVACLAALPLPTAVRAEAADRLEVEILDQQPAVLTSASDVRLRLALTNRGSTPALAPQLSARLQTWTPVSRASLEDWLSGDSDAATREVATAELSTLAPGERRVESLTIDGEDLHGIGRGPRGLLVQAWDGSGKAKVREGAERSFLILWPDTSFPPIDVTVLGPLTPNAEELQSEDPYATTERLATLCDLLEQPGAVGALDPAVTGLADHPVGARLPTADPDVSTLAATAEGRRLLRGAASGSEPGPLLWWPRTADEASVAATPPGAVLVVEGSSSVNHPDIYYTPSGLAQLSARSEAPGQPALVIDRHLSDHLRAPGDSVRHRQALLAHIAAVVRERPHDPRTLVLALSRTGAGADPTELSARLSAVFSAPFAHPAPLPPLVDGAWRTEQERVSTQWTLTGEGTSSSSLGADLATSYAAAARVAGLAGTPNELMGELTALGDRAAATAMPMAERARLLGAVHERAEAIASGVEVESSSSLLLISDRPDIPVHVVNRLPVDISATIDLLAEDPRLQIPGPVEAQLDAEARTTVSLPVNAVGSGDLKVRIRVLDSSGEVIADSAPFDVRVRADWENVGTLIVGVLLALLVVVGVARTIRRHRRDPETQQRRRGVTLAGRPD